MVLLNSSSTSSSLIFSPRLVRMYLIWPLPTKPLRSLSKTWNPRMYSSMSKGSRKPPGRFRILLKVSKSTAHTYGLAIARSRVSGECEGRSARCSWGGLWVRTVCANAALEIRDLSERRVLSTGAQQVAEGRAVDAAVAALVEELEGFAVVGGGLVVVSVVVHADAVRFRRRRIVMGKGSVLQARVRTGRCAEGEGKASVNVAQAPSLCCLVAVEGADGPGWSLLPFAFQGSGAEACAPHSVIGDGKREGVLRLSLTIVNCSTRGSYKGEGVNGCGYSERRCSAARRCNGQIGGVFDKWRASARGRLLLPSFRRRGNGV